MADNFPLTPGTGRNAATDQVTYSGDTADVQLTRIVQVTGSEGSKTVVDLPGDATNGLDVDVTRVSGTVTIAGAVTNAGTFAVQVSNTVTVTGTVAATQSGTWTEANSAATAASLSVMDDWDESDRCKVNIIAGQAGIAGGTGTDGATVPRVTLATNVPLPAGTNLLGREAASLETSTIYNATTALTPKFAAISTASSGNTTIVAAVTSKKIRVLSYRFQGDADVSVKFRDNTAGVDLTGAMATGAKGGGGGAAFSPVGHFETASGNALSINLSGAVQVSGHITYVEV